MANLEVTIENCNSIDTAAILVTEGCLNIKYGPNGIGKSTIAKAIVGQARQDGSLNAHSGPRAAMRSGAAKPCQTPLYSSSFPQRMPAWPRRPCRVIVGFARGLPG